MKRLFLTVLFSAALAPLLMAAAPARTYESGYAQGITDSCAGIMLIQPEAFDYVLNLNKKKIHKAGKSCTSNMKQSNTAYYSGSYKDLLSALGALGWRDDYNPCSKCRPDK